MDITFEMPRCLLIKSKVAKYLQKYVIRSSVYIRKSCFYRKTGKTSFEMFTSQKPDISNMPIFVTSYFAYIQNETKLNPTSKQAIFLGYDVTSSAYLIYFLDRKEIKRITCSFKQIPTF